jgi:hypothetical protein
MMQNTHTDTIYNKVIHFAAFMIAQALEKFPKLAFTALSPTVSIFLQLQ